MFSGKRRLNDTCGLLPRNPAKYRGGRRGCGTFAAQRAGAERRRPAGADRPQAGPRQWAERAPVRSGGVLFRGRAANRAIGAGAARFQFAAHLRRPQWQQCLAGKSQIGRNRPPQRGQGQLKNRNDRSKNAPIHTIPMTKPTTGVPKNFRLR